MAGFSGFFSLFFAPILFHNLLLGDGDALVYYLPAFLSPPQLWSDLIFGGYPVAADPQMMTWYPPAMLMRLIPGSWNGLGSWNGFVVLAYVLAASFAYLYSWTVTRSRLAAWGAGLVYALSGFMIGHLSHTSMIHAAAWIPLILAALEQLRYRWTRRWWAIAIGAIAGCWLGGHPQVPVYGLGLGLLYALVMGGSAPVGRWRYYLSVISALAIGLMLCAIQILPTWQLSQLSVRAEMTFAAFTAYSLPPWQAAQMLFPLAFGGTYHPLYAQAYWGQWGPSELAGYVGLMPLLLAAIALLGARPRRLVYFWLGVGVIAFLLAMGQDTPLAAWLYKVPVYNRFRGQGRHMVEVAVAASALTGLGLATLQQRRLSRRTVSAIVVGGALIMLATSGWLNFSLDFYRQFAAEQGISSLDFRPWASSRVGIPLLTFGLSGMALLVWSKRRHAPWAMAVLCAALIWDLSSFGWFWIWQPINGAVSPSLLNPPASVSDLRDRLGRSQQRLLTTKGAQGLSPTSLMVPNMTRVWQLPNASGYTPLMLARLGKMLDMAATGLVSPLSSQPRDRALDLMSVRYALMPPPRVQGPFAGQHWSAEDIPLAVGYGSCAARATPTLSLDLPPDLPAVDAIGLVSALSCAPAVANNVEIAKIEAIAADGKISTASIRAGRDTAEWAYDCTDVQPTMQHQRAPLFQSTPVIKPGVARCSANTYVSTIPLDRPQKLQQLRIQSSPIAGVPGLRLDIHKLSLLHKSPLRSSQVLNQGLTPILAGPRWQSQPNIGDIRVYENQFAMPRAWLVSEWIQAPPAAILTAIQTAQLPDGRTFDPHRMALVEGWGSQKLPDLQPTDVAQVVKIVDTQVQIQTQTAADAFLVLSDVNYPGWQVTIDGQVAPLLSVNYVQRGVKVPAGSHLVQFAFRPRLFTVGAIVTGLAVCLGMMGWGWLGRWSHRGDRDKLDRAVSRQKLNVRG